MTPQEYLAWVDAIIKGGAIGVLLIFVIGLVKGWWMTEIHHSEVVSLYKDSQARYSAHCAETGEDVDKLTETIQSSQALQQTVIQLLRERPCLLDDEQPAKRRR